jgi:tRNA pseudouridine13 synthase
LKEKIKRLYSVDYNAGTLLFYDELVSDMPQTFTTIGPEMKPKDYEERIIKKVMEKQSISIDQLDIKKSGAYFGIYDRNVLLRPEKFTLSEALDDELNKGRLKLPVKFSVPKGSYATVIIKRLFL